MESESSGAGGGERPSGDKSGLVIGLAIAGGGLLMLCVCGGLLAGLLVPNLMGAREQARIQTCKTNLRVIGFAAENYAQVYSLYPHGADPLDGLRLLVREGYIDNPKVLVCPASGDGPLNIGVTGQRITDPKRAAAALGPRTCSYRFTTMELTLFHSGALPLCMDETGNHPGGVNVLFKDNHVDHIEDRNRELPGIVQQMGTP